MIIFVVSADHTYTHRALVGQHTGVTVAMLTYGELLQLRQAPRATYIFTDHDRLPTETLLRAANIYRQLRRRGITLNDPARVLSRYGLLRALYLRGINQFNAYRAEEAAAPARWPVFLRTEGDHNGPLPDLFHTPDELAAGIARALDRGIPMSRLLVVEYAAEPVRPGLFRKFSVFRLGPASFAHTCVDDNHWIAKNGTRGVSPPEFFDEEFRIVRDNPYGPAVAAAFDAAGIDYGRADFGMVGGKVQIYEINSNPHVVFDDDNPSARRHQTYGLFKQNYCAALRAIDSRSAAGPQPAPRNP